MKDESKEVNFCSENIQKGQVSKIYPQKDGLQSKPVPATLTNYAPCDPPVQENNLAQLRFPLTHAFGMGLFGSREDHNDQQIEVSNINTTFTPSAKNKFVSSRMSNSS